jgi:phosphoribosyl-AMP cyclohydrolase
MDSALDQIKWSEDGLVPAIAQDWQSGEVLMMAWMNRESLSNSITSGEVVYWSRSRQRLWHKGESSGHTQKIKAIRLDCDGDVLLLAVEQVGAIACHTGRRSCFYRRLDQGEWHITDAIVKSPQAIYGSRDD